MSRDSSRNSGANPGQGSKRKNSNSSIDTNSNKKSKQQTLGVAWGASSRSASRSSSFRRSAPFSDFGSYMVEKNRKLQNQFDAEASTSSQSDLNAEKSLFNGISIFVDGFTVPSNQELRGYMLKYGGRYENYFSRHRVTHIICSNLPDSKIKNIRSFSGGLPVVKPEWILDCIVAKKVLSWVPYQLDQLANNQPKLSSFFGPKTNTIQHDPDVAIQQGNSDPSLKDDTYKSVNLSESCEFSKDVKQDDGQVDNCQQNAESQDSESEVSFDSKVEDPNDNDLAVGNCVNSELFFNPQQDSALIASLDNHTLSGSTVAGNSTRLHSTIGDPDFVENYFKNSRLHFIGTWKTRYRKRFPSVSSEKFGSLSYNVSDDSQKTTVMHIDMDCFFVSVVTRNHPELQDKPVAVCHSDNPKGTAEISSANYPARDYGVKAGIFVRDAKALCAHLAIVPYDFHAYEEVADQFYSILHKHCSRVQAVSCDEAFLDVTDSEVGYPEVLASRIREEIFATTRCTASAGIAGNMLMARLATRSAKPNGQCYLPSEKVDEYLDQLSIKALPGIGYAIEKKLKEQNVLTCGQLRQIPKEAIQKDFGLKTGEMLWKYSRGIDCQPVGAIQESKSIGAEVNWGVRLKDLQHTRRFLLSLCKEVSLRMQGCGLQGRSFTLKIKKRRKNAKEPAKYMGCGDCENLSHSMTVPMATNDVEVLQRITKQLFGFFHMDVKDIRGVGLQVTKLEVAGASTEGRERNFLRSWLTSSIGTAEPQQNISNISTERDGKDAARRGTRETSALPPICNLDIGVVESLPSELFSELNETYGGKLVDLIAKRKEENGNLSCPLNVSSCDQVETHDGTRRIQGTDATSEDSVGMEQRIKQRAANAKFAPSAEVRFNDKDASAIELENNDLMPSSLSQIDKSVLQELPEELKVDILGLLPVHRREKLSSDTVLGPPRRPHESLDVKSAGKKATPADFGSLNFLWAGNPPVWVDKFKSSNYMVLYTLADMYSKMGSSGNLSLILQSAVSKSLSFGESSGGWDAEAGQQLCELLRQYIEHKIKSDIEEIYICFRLLKRFTSKSRFFSEVYNTVSPCLQESVRDYYGGELRIA